jgi:threonine dehydratase
MIPEEWIAAAADNIAPHIKVTPLTYDDENDLYIKWENRQVTGSFKARGALNKILNLEDWERAAGIITASAGNHGLGVALASQMLGIPATIYAPNDAPANKIKAIQKMGAKIELVPGGYGEAEKVGLKKATESSATWVSPYNDGHVIAGQATLARETVDQLASYPDCNINESVWLIPVSGGGLVAGMASALKHLPAPPKVVAVQAKTAAYMHALFYRGTQNDVVESPTLADGLAGPVEKDAITIPLVRQYVDEIILVDEYEISTAIANAWHNYGERIEGAAAVTLAAALSSKVSKRPAVILISGGNIEADIHQRIISKER